MNFLGLGPGELFLVMLLALIVFGPGKLPEIGRGLGKAIGEFRRATSEITQEFNRELQLDSILNPPEPAKPQGQDARSPEPTTETSPSAAPTISEELPNIEAAAHGAALGTATGDGTDRAEMVAAAETVVPAPTEDLTAVSVPEEPRAVEPETEPTVTAPAAAEDGQRTETVAEDGATTPESEPRARRKPKAAVEPASDSPSSL